MKATQIETILETDYLIVGCGAVGMAFADVILSETDANLILVDKLHKPGGHWNHAYSFVKLHQPSAYYGVSSVNLGRDDTDKVGVNKGLGYLSSGAEISAYYDDIMQRIFLPSGRVKYFPLCEYSGDNNFASILTGKSYKVRVNKKNVNAAHMQTKVPSTHTPNFHIAPEVMFIPINDLPKVTKPPGGWVVIGGGKTGVDAIIWLLEHKVDAAKITWIVPRDSWFTDRKNIQPSEEFLKYFLNDQIAQLEALEQAKSITDLFIKLEKAGVLLRIDKKVIPKMHRGATISELELEQLRRIKNIVRKGRIKRIEKDEIILEEGKIGNEQNQIFVDCSANALHHSGNKPIFSGNTITLQPVRGGQIVFSAAFIAHVETAYKDEMQKNKLCEVVPLPNHDTDWIKMFAGSMKNQHSWKKDPELTKWLYNNRLDGFSHLVADISDDDEELQTILRRLRNSIRPAMVNLGKLLL
ncbi:hypothetical protein MWU78_12875 [Arenibacter sp. F26102]|uniref:hypothetical protein n=1 Tax=Arenibacter sp. F26102 TaxID=2926416 RepID=UPI001FF17395|nr:hypothetical protein [Arenibacter sp. F26102]MCK0146541.1 hypothetical protein [Arenibacter sp. F26102]